VSTAEVIVHVDAGALAESIAARLVTRLVDVQSQGSTASVVLTGGGVGTNVLREIAASPARNSVDWHRVDVWWGDDRYVPADDDERNEKGAREALLDALPLDPARVHAMAASDAGFASPEAAAAAYADEVGDHPSFDVVLLGMGPDGHVASLFPEHPALHETDTPAVAVHGSPKPPPIRLSLTFPALNTAHEVWFLVAGAEKAGAVRLALEGAGRMQIPATGVTGTSRTLWLIDQAAASELPAGLARRSS